MREWDSRTIVNYCGRACLITQSAFLMAVPCCSNESNALWLPPFYSKQPLPDGSECGVQAELSLPNFRLPFQRPISVVRVW